jgi:hypothetical protein
MLAGSAGLLDPRKIHGSHEALAVATPAIVICGGELEKVMRLPLLKLPSRGGDEALTKLHDRRFTGVGRQLRNSDSNPAPALGDRRPLRRKGFSSYLVPPWGNTRLS